MYILGLSNIILRNVLVIYFFLWYQIPSLNRYTTITFSSDQSSENNWVLNADQRVDRQPENPVLLHRKWKDKISKVNALYHFYKPFKYIKLNQDINKYVYALSTSLLLRYHMITFG